VCYFIVFSILFLTLLFFASLFQQRFAKRTQCARHNDHRPSSSSSTYQAHGDWPDDLFYSLVVTTRYDYVSLFCLLGCCTPSSIATRCRCVWFELLFAEVGVMSRHSELLVTINCAPVSASSSHHCHHPNHGSEKIFAQNHGIPVVCSPTAIETGCPRMPKSRVTRPLSVVTLTLDALE
jgi:hypothetical protein